MGFLMSDAQRFATAVLCLVDEGMLIRGGNFTVESLVKLLEHGTTYRAKRKRGRQPYELEAMILGHARALGPAVPSVGECVDREPAGGPVEG